MRGFSPIALAALVVLSLFIGGVSAHHPEEKPESVTITCDEGLLNDHRPWLDTRGLDVQPLALHGFVAESPNEDTTMLVYSAEYTHQSGVREFDSHYGDHEWVYVELNQRKEVVATYYSGYHWYKATDYAQNVKHGHPRFTVVNPWHHYVSDAGQDKPDDAYSTQADIPLKCLDESLPNWLDNGLEDDLAQGTVYDPWTMKHEDSWWSGNTWDSRGHIFAKVWFKVGWHDADLSDVEL